MDRDGDQSPIALPRLSFSSLLALPEGLGIDAHGYSLLFDDDNPQTDQTQESKESRDEDHGLAEDAPHAAVDSQASPSNENADQQQPSLDPTHQQPFRHYPQPEPYPEYVATPFYSVGGDVQQPLPSTWSSHMWTLPLDSPTLFATQPYYSLPQMGCSLAPFFLESANHALTESRSEGRSNGNVDSQARILPSQTADPGEEDDGWVFTRDGRTLGSPLHEPISLSSDLSQSANMSTSAATPRSLNKAKAGHRHQHGGSANTVSLPYDSPLLLSSGSTSPASASTTSNKQCQGRHRGSEHGRHSEQGQEHQCWRRAHHHHHHHHLHQHHPYARPAPTTRVEASLSRPLDGRHRQRDPE